MLDLPHCDAFPGAAQPLAALPDLLSSPLASAALQVVVVWKDRAVRVPMHPARRVLAPKPIIALSEAVWEQIYDPGMLPGGAVLLMPSLHKSPSLDIRRKICRQIQGSDQAYPGVEQIAFAASSCWNLVTLSDL